MSFREYRLGRMETETMGGFVHTVPTQAAVITFCRSVPRSSAPQVISAAGTGASMAPGFRLIKDIFFPLILVPASPLSANASPADRGALFDPRNAVLLRFVSVCFVLLCFASSGSLRLKGACFFSPA